MIEPGALPPPESALASLGGKALRLARLASAGMPVPAGFVLPSTTRLRGAEGGAASVADLRAFVGGAMERLEGKTGLQFGSPRRPLLVSVRSGAAVSMPGMLETVLNVGLTRATLPGLVELTGNPHLAWDCFARVIEAFATTVRGADRAPFGAVEADVLQSDGAASRTELDTLRLRDLVFELLKVFESVTGSAFPEDPYEQLAQAVDAVFRSWDSQQATRYREIHALHDLPGTAVTIQQMVYGNSGARSGAGVGFTRDPATGDKTLYMEFAFSAQGEDVVSGRRRLEPVTQLQRQMPHVVQALQAMATRLEETFHDAQDFEFTVDESRLYLLQTRDATCAPWARLKITVDLGREGVITPAQALARVADLDVSTIARRRLAAGADGALARGVPASMGVAAGTIALTAEAARAAAAAGRHVIFVRGDLETADLDGIASADGILTARGGRTSHAAVVARELGKVAIVGCNELTIASDERSCRLGGRRLEAGAEITLDGESGRVYPGALDAVEERPLSELAQLEEWKATLA